MASKSSYNNVVTREATNGSSFDPERVLSKIERSDGCWSWNGAHYPTGYAQFSYRDSGRTRTYGAHRVVYELLVGPIPAGLELDHVCRNRGCVNPEHLEPVTPAENKRRAIGQPSSAPPADWKPSARSNRPKQAPPAAGAIGDLDTRVLLAVIAADRSTVSSVARDTGRARSLVQDALTRLRDAGLVTWETGKKGTLRSTVRVVNADDPLSAPVPAWATGRHLTAPGRTLRAGRLLSVGDFSPAPRPRRHTPAACGAAGLLDP